MINVISLKRVADLGQPPITLAEAKAQLIVDFSDDDTLITSLLTKATRAVESHCNISIIYQRIELTADFTEEWHLPWGPVVGVESVLTPVGNQGSGPTAYTVDTADWGLDGDDFNPKGCRRMRITYTAGNYCPDDLKQVILEVLTFMYENRGKTADAGKMEDILAKADSYRNLGWV